MACRETLDLRPSDAGQDSRQSTWLFGSWNPNGAEVTSHLGLGRIVGHLRIEDEEPVADEEKTSGAVLGRVIVSGGYRVNEFPRLPPIDFAGLVGNFRSA